MLKTKDNKVLPLGSNKIGWQSDHFHLANSGHLLAHGGLGAEAGNDVRQQQDCL